MRSRGFRFTTPFEGMTCPVNSFNKVDFPDNDFQTGFPEAKKDKMALRIKHGVNLKLVLWKKIKSLCHVAASKKMIAQQSFYQHTSHTIKTAHDLETELHQIKMQGFAFDREEHEEKIICIARQKIVVFGSCKRKTAVFLFPDKLFLQQHMKNLVIVECLLKTKHTMIDMKQTLHMQ